MENKDTKTEYQEVLRVGDQKWELESFFFFCLRFIFIIHIHHFLFSYICREFSCPTRKKITPTQSANSHSKSQFDLRTYYINFLKNGSISPLSPRGDANYKIPLDMSMYIFKCNKTVEAIILKCLQGHP